MSIKISFNSTLTRESAINKFDFSSNWFNQNEKWSFDFISSICIFSFKSNQRKRKLQKPIFSFYSKDIFSKKYLVSLNFMFCSLPLVMFCQKTNFLINFFPPIKLDSNLLFWSLISLIAKLVRKINSWFHATIEIIKELKRT